MMRTEPDGGTDLQVRALGRLRAWHQGFEIALGAPKQRAVFAVLALRHGRQVRLAELIDAVWETDPPPSAESLVYTYIARLRRALETGGHQSRGDAVLASAESGYRLRLESARLDVAVFEEQLRAAKRERAVRRPNESDAMFAAALGLWHGEPLAGVPGPFAQAQRARLAEIHLDAVEAHVEVALELGRHTDLAVSLAALVREHPLRERLRELHMLALYRCGRQADALACFTDARRTLVDTLGIEPGPALKRLHAWILASDPRLEQATPIGPGPANTAARPLVPAARLSDSAVGSGTAAEGRHVTPAQLPRDLADFTGRDAEVERITGRSVGNGSTAAAAVFVISGVAGVGKTALAIHCGHRIASWCPDGQLYVNLCGFDPSARPLTPDEVLDRLLRDLGVAPQQIPSDLEDRASYYRSVLNDRRVLIVLDDAATASQVRPLLPGGPRVTVLITSRNRLAELIVRDGACGVPLDVFEPRVAARMWTAMVGAGERPPDSVRQLVELCGHHPLALRIVCERVARMGRPDLDAVVADLAGRANRRLDALDVEGVDGLGVRAALSWSYRMLPPGAARMFRRLGLHKGPDFGVGAAAVLAGVQDAEACGQLAVLSAGHLVEPVGLDRYRLHDLVRMYALECCEAEDSASDAAAAIVRLTQWYLHSAAAAARILAPHLRRVLTAVDDVPRGHPVPDFAKPAEALRWLDAEQVNLVAVAAQAAQAREREGHSVAWEMPMVMWSFFALRRYGAECLATTQRGLECARRAGDPVVQAHLLTSLGHAHHRVTRRYDEALDCLTGAERMFAEAGDRTWQAAALKLLGEAACRNGDRDAAGTAWTEAVRIFEEIGDPRAADLRALIGGLDGPERFSGAEGGRATGVASR